MALGEGRTLAEIMGERHSVAEGVHTAAALGDWPAATASRCRSAARSTPFSTEGADIDETIASLMARPFRIEGR